MIPQIAIDMPGLRDYMAFQFCLAGKTLFEGGEGFEGAGHGADHGPKSVRVVTYWSLGAERNPADGG